MRLTESSGDVTEDRALVEGLEESKKLSKEITHKLAEMKVQLCYIVSCSLEDFMKSKTACKNQDHLPLSSPFAVLQRLVPPARRKVGNGENYFTV